MIFFLATFLRTLLSFRYRRSLKGFEVFSQPGQKIVFPNHPALVDPLMVIAETASRGSVLSPIMTETFFHIPGLGPLLRALKTIPVGDLSRGGCISDVTAAFHGITQALKAGQNILLYPSGGLYVQPFEHISGKRMAFEIVSRLQGNEQIILIRTRGLWGSMWGKGYTGEIPHLPTVIVKSVWYILANIFFFLPKRTVYMEAVDMTSTLKEWYSLGLQNFNEKLTEWYNAPGTEPCQYIPHYCYYNDVSGRNEPKNIPGSLEELAQGQIHDTSEIPQQIGESVCVLVGEILSQDHKDWNMTTNVILDLHCDSLSLAEIKAEIQNRFSVTANPPLSSLKTIGDLCILAVGKLQDTVQLPPCLFTPNTSNIIPQLPQYKNLLEGFRDNFRHHIHDQFCYDALLGSQDRKTFALRAYVIAAYLHTYSAPRMGIMLPALSATSLLLVATMLAGKLPVMLNWTVGSASFEHCMKFAQLDTILTSKAFYAKLSSPWLAQFESKMLFIEDILATITPVQKITGLIKKFFWMIPSESEGAVMLFTSGSESLPKAILLSHENILADVRGAMHYVPFLYQERFLGFLPPFHSFGYTLNTIFPLIAPVQVAYSPDPNDARALAKLIQHCGIQVLSATPTFLASILTQSQNAALTTLRKVFVGAEKCNDSVFENFAKMCPQAEILEGYGITECSPIVSVNPLGTAKRGTVGKFLPHIQSSIRHIETGEELPLGESGMIFIAGSSIFSGYLDASIESPFEVFNGVKYYKTGDLGYLDTDGFLHITGRLKRFIKIAGEMISLPSLEAILLEKYNQPDAPSLALEARDDQGNITIVAFITFAADVSELNQYLVTHGASALAKISRVERIDAIPVLGTGKIDYKELKKRI